MAKLNNFRERWFKRYRLVLHEEQSYKERWQMSVNRWGLAATTGALVLVVIALTYVIVAWTPSVNTSFPGTSAKPAVCAQSMRNYVRTVRSTHW